MGTTVTGGEHIEEIPQVVVDAVVEELRSDEET
jgi:hypothetical protein